MTATPSDLDFVLAQLRTAEELGVVYLRNTLRADEVSPAPLLVQTRLTDPACCGRGERGWTVRGGVADAYTWVRLRDRPMLGNRSQLARFSFCSTQTGVPPTAHGLVEMRLCRGTTPDDLPLRIRVENGAFYILALNGDTLLAGDRETRVFPMTAGIVYTLTVLLFGKAVHARLAGADVPGGMVELLMPDRRRFIPGWPGFGLQPNALATGGGLTVFDWQVTPVGPAENCRLAAIGDSITAGNDGEPEAESYVHLATRALGQELVLNTGSGGSTTALDLERFPFEIAPFQPAVVWIESGGNDIFTGVNADAAWENMMRQAESVTWGGRAVLSTVSPLVLPTASHYAEFDRLNRFIRESGRLFVDRQALVCDLADPHHLRPEFCKPDGIHITQAGHEAIAAGAIRVFRSLQTEPA